MRENLCLFDCMENFQKKSSTGLRKKLDNDSLVPHSLFWPFKGIFLWRHSCYFQNDSTEFNLFSAVPSPYPFRYATTPGNWLYKIFLSSAEFYLYRCNNQAASLCWDEASASSLLAVPWAAPGALYLLPFLWASWQPRRTCLRCLKMGVWSDASLNDCRGRRRWKSRAEGRTYQRCWGPRISRPDRSSPRLGCWWRASDDAEIPSRRPSCFDCAVDGQAANRKERGREENQHDVE